jgi:hypothetical protein
MTQEETPKPGEMYRHFKGGRYEIVGISRFESTEEILVTYKPLYTTEGKIKNWTRTLDNFFETVEKTLPNGAKYFGPRFVRD